MKQLYPIQQKAHDHFLGAHLAGFSTVDLSETGSGKTVTAVRLMKSLGQPFGIVAPKITLTQWQRACEEDGVEPLFILSYEKLNAGNTPWFDKVVKKVKKRGGGEGKRRFFKWHLPEDAIVVWDEVHRCANGFTGYALAHIKATQTGHRSHSLSATAFEDPTEMRAIGFALGLHTLDVTVPKKRTWFSWLRFMKCSQDPWKKWYATASTREKMPELREWMYRNRGFKVRREDMPEAFRDNQIIIEPVDLGNQIDKYYESRGFTPAILLRYIEDGDTDDLKSEDAFVVELLRARQAAEAYKVPTLIEMAQDLLAEGKSVVIFLNFTDSIRAVMDAFDGCGVVSGSIDAENRQAHIDNFNTGTSRLICVQSAAGGTGLSLHDTIGDFPRAALISPGWSAKQMVQIMGRTSRAGMKSPTIQKIIVAAGSVEEDVWRAVEKRMNNLNLMLG